MINIKLNGETKEIPDGISLSQLLEQLGLPMTRVAVELNREVVRRFDWDDTVVSDADAIEVVHFVGGG